MQIEDILLQDSQRGMKQLAAFLPKDFCMNAARSILNTPKRGCLIATGFYVGGFPETDGPPGALCLAQALEKLGFETAVITDKSFAKIFDGYEDRIITVTDKADSKLFNNITAQYDGGIFISVERCGRNKYGRFCNMRGVDISAHTAPVDCLFINPPNSIVTVGIGDGGNEIGMGNLADKISAALCIEPSVVKANHLILSSVSNIGAYGLTACLSKLTRRDLLPNGKFLTCLYEHMLAMGCVDGITREASLSADGFPIEHEISVIEKLRAEL